LLAKDFGVEGSKDWARLGKEDGSVGRGGRGIQSAGAHMQLGHMHTSCCMWAFAGRGAQVDESRLNGSK